MELHRSVIILKWTEMTIMTGQPEINVRAEERFVSFASIAERLIIKMSESLGK